MSTVRDAYDASAELYASMFRDELRHDEQSTRQLTSLAELAAGRSGPVADLGCGPGTGVAFLHRLGVAAFGVDISEGQIEQARLACPDLRFQIGDLGALAVADASLGGIVARHSVIHLPPSGLPAVFDEWWRALEPGAPVFVSFFGARSVEAHGETFDHRVTTAFALHPPTVERELLDAGFASIAVEATPLPPDARPFDHATILAHKPAP